MLFFENSIIIKPSLGSCEVQQKNRSPTQGYKQKIQVRKLFTILNQEYTIFITVLYISICGRIRLKSIYPITFEMK